MTEQTLGAFVVPTPEDREVYYGAIDPLDERYKDAEVQKYLSEETRIATQAYVEAALGHTLADFGLCSREAALEIERACSEVSAKEVSDREYGRGEFKGLATRHDIKALTDAIAQRVSDEARPWVHAMATSYDIISTANALQTREAMHGLVLPRIIQLGDTLAELTDKYADTPQIARTHGQHAVPMTFGFGISRYLGRLGDSLLALNNRTDNLQGKFSGAIGGFNAASLLVDQPAAFEKALMDKLGLQACSYATQIVPAENMLRMLSELGITSGIMAQVATDMRQLQRSEIGEVGEPFDEHQTGSSAMPQKRNPINFENVASLHKEVLGQIMSANLNLVSEHQRDLTDSASSRFYGIVFATVARMASTLNRTMAKMEVDPVNLERNLNLTQGAIAAEPLQIVLRKYGHPAAHNTAKVIVQAAIDNGQTLSEALVANEEFVRDYRHRLSEEERNIIAHPEANYLGLTPQLAQDQIRRWNLIKIV